MNRAERGQAMVEAAIAVALLGLVLASMPAVLTYHDVARAAHRAAFDEALMGAWNGSAEAAALDRRLREQVEVLSWRRPSDAATVVAAADARSSVADATPPGRAAGLLEFIAAPLSAPGGYGSAGFELTRAGYRTASAELRTSPLRGAPEPFASLDLTFAGTASVLTDAWNASGSPLVVERVAGLVPTAALRDVGRELDVLRGALSLIEPAFEDLCPGRIDAEAVPASRLAGIDARASDERRRERCQ